MSLARNELIKFIDFIIPLTRVPLAVPRGIIEKYKIDQKTRSLLHGDTIDVWEESLSTLPSLLPDHLCDELAPLITALCEKRSMVQPHVPSLRLLDLVIVLTILGNGKLRDKAQLLYSLFATSEPEGLLEWEHSRLIQRISSCLKKIGALKGSEISADDANYLAFLARIKEERRGFHLSLSFQEFFHWIQNSPETAPAFLFIRLINRLIRITQTLNQRADSLTSLLSEITADNFSTQTIHILKLSSSHVFLPLCPVLIHLTDKSAHFILRHRTAEHPSPASLRSPNEHYYLQIETVHPITETERSTERYYVTTTRQEISPVFSKSLSTMRLDVLHSLSPDTAYLLTFYTSSGTRFPVISLRTKPHHTMLTAPTFSSQKVRSFTVRPPPCSHLS
jgi:hypothetical protein